MDKYDTVLYLIEHPAKYSHEKIEEILSDPEAKDVYNLLCKTSSALAATDDKVDIDAEWQTFSRRHHKPKARFLWSGNRAASIAAIALTSLAAVAIGITVAVKTFEPKPQDIMVEAESSAASSVSNPKPIGNTQNEVEEDAVVSDSPVLFEDASLEEILDHVADVHSVTVEYNSPETARLHLYYKFDPSISLTETVEQLNTFEQINIHINGKKILVD